MTTTTPAPAEALSEPRRIRRELLDSFPMPRECSVCGCHKTLDIEYVCGGCRDDEYLGEWQQYARAQAARAQAAEGREAIRVEQLRRIDSVKRFAAEQAARGIGQGYHDIATALRIALEMPLYHPETGAALSVEESLARASAEGATVQVCRVCGHWGSILRHDSGCPVPALQSAFAQSQAHASSATQLLKMVNYLLEQAKRREDEAARHPADSPTRIHFAAMAEADRDTATELGILAHQLAQAHADQQARLKAVLIEADRTVEAADHLGVTLTPTDDLGYAIRGLEAAVEKYRFASTSGASHE